MNRTEPWLVVGQGLAGTSLALEFLARGVPFRVIDPGQGGSTRVAAGLINPITGKNFEPSWLIEGFHPTALAFFEKLGREFGQRLWNPLPIMRLASSPKEWSKIESKLNLPRTRAWLHPEQAETPPGFHGSVVLTGGGWVDTPRFLSLTRARFEKLGLLETGRFDTRTPDPNAILCEGAAGLTDNQLGNHRCAKGEILTVRADWPETHIRIGAGGWLVPIGENLFRVGSTYEWNDLDETPTPAGSERIHEIATKIGGDRFEKVAHVAGVRPILRRSQPLIGKNRLGNWFFNGLGSKGTLYAPGMAAMLADWICGGKTPAAHFLPDPGNPLPEMEKRTTDKRG